MNTVKNSLVIMCLSFKFFGQMGGEGKSVIQKKESPLSRFALCVALGKSTQQKKKLYLLSVHAPPHARTHATYWKGAVPELIHMDKLFFFGSLCTLDNFLQ